MKFMIYTLARHPVPPEIMPALLDGVWGWATKYKESGKFESIWSFAGQPGGGAIVNVETADELDQILGEFPLSPFSEFCIYPITELKAGLDRGKQIFGQMAKMMQQK